MRVLIKEINGDKIALSRKFEDENPWLNAAEKYAVGNEVEGRVARMTDFGAFVELEPGIDACCTFLRFPESMWQNRQMC